MNGAKKLAGLIIGSNTLHSKDLRSFSGVCVYAFYAFYAGHAEVQLPDYDAPVARNASEV
jgi:hypothetical protein